MAQVYFLDIPSIRSSHPHLPPVLDVAAWDTGIDLSREIVAGQPLDQQNLDHARTVAESLRYLADNGHSLITPEIAESARLRMLAVESAHVSIAYPPADVLDQLQLINEGLVKINTRLLRIENREIMIGKKVEQLGSTINANAANSRNRIHNSMRTTPLCPLQKTISGHGYVKALAVCPAGTQLQEPAAAGTQLQEPAAAADIGLVPVPFNGRISAYTHAEILDLIVFYNDDFGIVAEDELPSRQDKVSIFLKGSD